MKNKKNLFIHIGFVVSCFLFFALLLTSCGINRSSFYPNKKYSLQQVEKDYEVYQTLLESHHPGLYWYSTKDSIDYFFKWGREQLKDSMTEPEFRKVLTYVTARINCGHTSVRSSKAWMKYIDTTRLSRLFPLSMKLWGGNDPASADTMVITTNLNRRDNILTRGTMVTGINGMSEKKITDTMFRYISSDGYNRSHKFQSLSNRGFYSSLYTSLFGLSDKYNIEYIDSLGQQKKVTIPVFNPVTDTATRNLIRTLVTRPQPSIRDRRLQQLSSVRQLQIDSVNHSAMMNLSTFGRGFGLRNFFRRSFKQIKKNQITHLIIDVRSNGGGSVTNSTFLTRLLANQPFRLSDSLYAIKKRSRYDKYIKNNFWNKLFIAFLTRKRKDGFYHFGYFERHYFKPRKHNHYNGKTYIITGGNSFSATTLFASSLIKQENVIVVGEETGGGAYGNSAWLIPDVTLPETGVRFRLPLFRLVIDKNAPKTGLGVQPEIFSGPSIDAVKRNADYKLETVMELIKKDKTRN